MLAYMQAIVLIRYPCLGTATISDELMHAYMYSNTATFVIQYPTHSSPGIFSWPWCSVLCFIQSYLHTFQTWHTIFSAIYTHKCTLYLFAVSLFLYSLKICFETTISLQFHTYANCDRDMCKHEVEIYAFVCILLIEKLTIRIYITIFHEQFGKSIPSVHTLQSQHIFPGPNTTQLHFSYNVRYT